MRKSLELKEKQLIELEEKLNMREKVSTCTLFMCLLNCQDHNEKVDGRRHSFISVLLFVVYFTVVCKYMVMLSIKATSTHVCMLVH